MGIVGTTGVPVSALHGGGKDRYSCMGEDSLCRVMVVACCLSNECLTAM